MKKGQNWFSIFRHQKRRGKENLNKFPYFFSDIHQLQGFRKDIGAFTWHKAMIHPMFIGILLMHTFFEQQHVLVFCLLFEEDLLFHAMTFCLVMCFKTQGTNKFLIKRSLFYGKHKDEYFLLFSPQYLLIKQKRINKSLEKREKKLGKYFTSYAYMNLNFSAFLVSKIF